MQARTELVQHLATHSLHDAEVDGMVRLCLNTALNCQLGLCHVADTFECLKLLVEASCGADLCDDQGRGLLHAALARLQAAWQLGSRGGLLSARALQLQSVFRLVQSLLKLVIDRESAFTGKLTI